MQLIKWKLLPVMLLLVFLSGILALAQGEILASPPLIRDLGSSSRNLFVTICSPQNGSVYNNVDSVFVNFTFNDVEIESLDPVNPHAEADIGYSLDGRSIERLTNFTFFKTTQGNMALTCFRHYSGNFSLSNLEIGNHSITIYDGYQHDFGKGEEYLVDAYANANFSVIAPSPSPFQSYPTNLPKETISSIVIKSIVIIAAVAAVLLIFLIRFRKDNLLF